MYLDMAKYYYKKAEKQGDSIVYKNVNDDEEKGYIVSVSEIYLGCKDDHDMKIKLIKDLRAEADKLYDELIKDECKKLTKKK